MRRQSSISLLMLSANKRVTVAISEAVCNDHDQVNQSPNSTAVQGQELNYANACFFV